jgi:hypothetical protein
MDKQITQPEQEPIEYWNAIDGWVTVRQEAAECWTTSATQTWKNFEAKLKEKNT